MSRAEMSGRWLSLLRVAQGRPFAACVVSYETLLDEDRVADMFVGLHWEEVRQRQAKGSLAGQRQANHATKRGRQAILTKVCDHLPPGLSRRERYAKIREQMLAQGFPYGKQSSSLTRDLHAIGRSWIPLN